MPEDEEPEREESPGEGEEESEEPEEATEEEGEELGGKRAVLREVVLLSLRSTIG